MHERIYVFARSVYGIVLASVRVSRHNRQFHAEIFARISSEVAVITAVLFFISRKSVGIRNMQFRIAVKTFNVKYGITADGRRAHIVYDVFAAANNKRTLVI